MTNIPFTMLDDKDSGVPLYLQIYEAVRQAILCGKFQPTIPLPATRILAKQLSVSRMTIINAYERLFAEGNLEGKIRAVTFVAAKLPEDFLQTSGIKRRQNQKINSNL